MTASRDPRSAAGASSPKVAKSGALAEMEKSASAPAKNIGITESSILNGCADMKGAHQISGGEHYRVPDERDIDHHFICINCGSRYVLGCGCACQLRGRPETPRRDDRT
ncbi:hypothetical protein [Sphingomonas quercus]|uniref:Uncharacterized protein n=1 Tax=Sphingomonas quercus TaxID=2842451 RepID=A0ABS6BMJ3_9SPHN|nr:hypothetical protein [Sphingomonas quercus]MBU3079530.1 hypothetical protein [Sphingomonas quercus]